MQTRIEMYVDAEEIRLVANTHTEIKAVLFDLIYRDVIVPEDVGVTMNTAVLGSGNPEAPDEAAKLAEKIRRALRTDGYRVV